MSTKAVQKFDTAPSTLSGEDAVKTARRLVRRGHFVEVAINAALITCLRDVSPSDDDTGKTRWLSARALLAEVFDQTGQYAEGASLFLHRDADELSGELQRRVRQLRSGKRSTAVMSDDVRRLIRAYVLYVLQAAISIHRQQRHDLTYATSLLERCLAILTNLDNSQTHFHGTLSLLHYWLGRMYLLKVRNRTEAREHFFESMRQTEKNLRFHSPRPLSLADTNDERVAFGVYSLASCMAFGLAELNHQAGKLSEATSVLQPAVAMLMGTGDNYRSGLARLNLGAAQRALGGRASAVESAIESMKIALELFGAQANNGLAHTLYEGVAHYQMSLGYVYLVQAETDSKESETTRSHYLKLAQREVRDGLVSAKCESSYKNDELKSKLWIVQSRLLREDGRYAQAAKAADEALKILKPYEESEEFASVDAWIAHGEASLAEAIHGGAAEKTVRMQIAENDFNRAARLARNSASVNAVTGLHLCRVLSLRGELNEARRVFHERWVRSEPGIENGWIKQLARQVARELGNDVLTVDMRGIKAELAQGQKVYKAVGWRVDDFLVGYAEKSGKTSNAQAAAVNWTRTTFINKRKRRDARKLPDGG